PATAFSSVDFPDPFVPMMITKEPSSTFKPTRCNDRTSFGVPTLNVFDIVLRSSMRSTRLSLFRNRRRRGLRFLRFQLSDHVWKNQCDEDENGRDQLQIIRIQSPSQSNRNHQSKQDGAHYCARDCQSETLCADQRFSDNHARQSPDHHPDSHLY